MMRALSSWQSLSLGHLILASKALPRVAHQLQKAVPPPPFRNRLRMTMGALTLESSVPGSLGCHTARHIRM